MNSKECTKLSQNQTVLRHAIPVLNDLIQKYLSGSKHEREVLVQKIDPLRKQCRRFLTESKMLVFFENKEAFSVAIGGASVEELTQKLKEQGVKIGAHVERLINNPQMYIEPVRRHLSLVVVTETDLGLRGYISEEDIYASAKKYGLELCPPETALYMALDNPVGTTGCRYNIAMDLFSDTDGVLLVGMAFFVDIRGKRALTDAQIQRNGKWVFVRP